MLMTLTTGSCRTQSDCDVTLLPPRNYDTTIGRFTSLDSFEGYTSDPLTLNHYLYASADPVNRIDPSGHGDFSLGEIGVSISIGVSIPVGLGAASSAVYAKVLGGDAGRGFVVGLQLGVAFDVAYFSGGGGIEGLKNFGDVVVNAFWTGVLKVASTNVQYKIAGNNYPASQQAQDFYEAFASAAFYQSFGDLIGKSDIKEDAGKHALATLLASGTWNFLAELPSVYRGEKGLLDGISNALQNTEVSFLQSSLINEAIKDFPTVIGRAALKTVLATAYQTGTDALLKIFAAVGDVLKIAVG